MKAPAGIVGRAAGHAPAICLAIAIVAVSLDDGGNGGIVIGLGSAAAWIAIVGLTLFRRSERPLTRGFLIAGAALAVLAILSALSLGWSPDRGAGFNDVVRLSGYLAVFVLAGMLFAPGSGRSALAGVAAGLVTVSLIAIGSRLLGVGAGDNALVAAFPSSNGRLSYPIGYWNALGAMSAMAVPVLVWLAAEARDRRTAALALSGFVPVLLATYMTSSRGALIAAAIGAGVAIWAAPHRGRALAALFGGVFAALPAVVAATLATGILDAPGTGVGRPELAVCCGIVVGVVLAIAVGPTAIERADGLHFARVRMRHLVIASLAVLAVLLVVVGPAEIAGDFAATNGREVTASNDSALSVSGSGRVQFWSSALHAFGSEPGRGIGAGGYESYWNQHGSLETPAQNAHSEPLELLAEVGPIGLLAFLAFFGVVAIEGIRRARGPDGGPSGACLGLLTTGMVGFLIDWTWDLPAVMVPVLAAAAMLCTRALDAESESVPVIGARTRFVTGSAVRVPAPAIALVAIAFAVPAVWAGGVLAAATDRLDASADALARGQFDEAAQAARSAAAIEPWWSDPWLQLATVEQAAGNDEAALKVTGQAVRLAPQDFRPAVLAAILQVNLGNPNAFSAYATRSLNLAPLVLPRASIDPDAGFNAGP